jgi:hypothetical protein
MRLHQRNSALPDGRDYGNHLLWSACIGSKLTFINTVVASGRHDESEEQPKCLSVQRVGADVFIVCLEGTHASKSVSQTKEDALFQIEQWMTLLGHVTCVEWHESNACLEDELDMVTLHPPGLTRNASFK